MKHPVLLAVLALAGLATAQGRGMQPMPPMPRAPAVPQPAHRPPPPPQFEAPPRPDPTPAPAADEEPAKKRKPVDPDTVGPKVAGKDLKKVVKAVKGLKWDAKLSSARLDSAASGKPILMIQALGKIDGLA